MKQTKKVLCLILVVVFSLSFAYPAVNAESAPESAVKIIVQPMFMYVDSFENSFFIAGGAAYLYSCLRSSQADQLRISMYLQKFIGGFWQPYFNWSNSVYGTSLTMYQCVISINPGDYRQVSYGDVYINGSLVETARYVGQTVHYN